MGTDIYSYVCVKDGNKWRTVSEIHLGRCYDWYSRIAGIRGPYEPVVEPRGIPQLDHPHIYSEWSDHNGYAPGWLTLAELKQTIELTKEGADDPESIEWLGERAIRIMTVLEECLDTETRLVFWFD